MSLNHLPYCLLVLTLLTGCATDSAIQVSPTTSQVIDNTISPEATQQILSVLADDDMQGRKDGSIGGQRAARYIEQHFKAAGLLPFDGLKSYRQVYSYSDQPVSNILGVIKGKSRPDEFVVFGAHYDHLGTTDQGGDRIFNGANDDASGVTALIQLAKYYTQLGNNERSIVFVAFSGEEAGGFGSKAFSQLLDPTKVVAMFNIEMIGTQSKWGRNSAYITGFDRSDFGTILQQNLKESNFNFYPDPYPEQDLFYRSDNATLAAQGVPAHTISTSKMDNEPYYHTVDDEIETLDIANTTAIIKAIAISATSIISGQSTPTRIQNR